MMEMKEEDVMDELKRIARRTAWPLFWARGGRVIYSVLAFIATIALVSISGSWWALVVVIPFAWMGAVTGVPTAMIK